MTANKYPELPEVKYEKTSVDMNEVIDYIKQSNYSVDVKCATYVIFRIESANGKSGVNNNYIGLQADNSKWDDVVSSKIIATSVMNENMTGKSRRFACFLSFKDSVDILEYKLVDRGLFIGGRTHLITKMSISTVEDLCKAYAIEWVYGTPNAVPDTDTMSDFKSMYSQACLKFN